MKNRASLIGLATSFRFLVTIATFRRIFSQVFRPGVQAGLCASPNRKGMPPSGGPHSQKDLLAEAYETGGKSLRNI
jgi:hypothetical protein